MIAAILFSGLVTILIVGWLWFYIARPILEDFGIIRVNSSEEDAPDVMSRSNETPPQNIPSSLQTDNRQTADRPAAPPISRDVMLDTYRLLRKYGIPREEARPILKAAGLPLDNNLWTEAAPVHVTPIAGRATRAAFDTDPELVYQPPE